MATSFRGGDRYKRRWRRRGDRRVEAVIRRVRHGLHGALQLLRRNAADTFPRLGRMAAMNQAAHTIALRLVRGVRARNKSQRRGEERNDH
jgi:hypothetical protein